ncbi:MAG: hypothetical protein OEY88_06080 [Candidatus Bathyarchaeota archaeon]|nr:hypothetical protein [Candidatus Bathyarchaeota archaeon]
MKKELEESIERTYKSIQRSIPSAQIDSLEVVKQVEEYRQFWKPKETNVVLLAESHVYTDEKDFEIELNSFILHRIITNYPLRFVRFVYCLGYGENELLTRTRIDRKNTGTPQFWKIFSSCVAESEDYLGFNKILKTRTRSFIPRLHNKVSVLQEMKEKGIWLLDASIVGLYESGLKKYPVTCDRIIEDCWYNHVGRIVKHAQPRHVIVIGKGVGKNLHSELQKLSVPITIVRQPQGDRRSSEKQLEKFIKCQRICTRYT